jgi:chromosomal replication initiator protein
VGEPGYRRNHPPYIEFQNTLSAPLRTLNNFCVPPCWRRSARSGSDCGWEIECGCGSAAISLFIDCPTRLHLDWVRSHLRTEIETVLRRCVGDLGSVEFRVAPQGTPEPAAPSASPIMEVAAAKDTARRPASTNSADEPAAESKAKPRKFAGFASFIVGSGNRVAYTAAEMVVERPGTVSPLFLYGPHGVGKTHLLESIWTETKKRDPRQRTVFLSAEQFTSYFLEALNGKGLPSFRRKYRDAALLIIDDVQFLLGKKATVVELKHTVDQLAREGRQLVLAADRSPQELAELGPELAARLGAGLVCGIAPPDQKTREQLVKQAAANFDLKLAPAVRRWLAERIAPDARMLTGAVNKLWAVSVTYGRKIDVALAEECLTDLTATAGAAVRLTDIDRAVCDVFGLPAKALQSDRKTRKLAYPRMLAMWLARKHTRSALTEIGEYFGRRSHSTVISAEKKVGAWMETNEGVELGGARTQLADALGKIEQRLRSR